MMMKRYPVRRRRIRQLGVVGFLTAGAFLCVVPSILLFDNGRVAPERFEAWLALAVGVLSVVAAGTLLGKRHR